MTARICHVRNMLSPAVGLRAYADVAGMTVSEAIEAAAWTIPSTTVLVRNGNLVKRSDFDTDPIGEDEQIVLVTVPQGGKGASQIFAVIASIALMIFAPPAGGALLGEELAGTVAFAGVTWGQVASAVILVAGNMLISTLLPKPKSISGSSATSPTYSLNAQSNQARLGQAIPEWFGRNQIFPDLASQPYFDYASNDQELFELFCVGQGQYSIEEIRVGDNAVWKQGAYTGTYPEIQIEIVNPGEQITLFPDNVVSSGDVSNIPLLGTNEEDYGWSGPFVVCPAGTKAMQIAVDIVLPAGLFKMGSTLSSASVQYQFQAQAIDNNGNATGSWFDVVNTTLTMTQNSAIRKTHLIDMSAPDRYQVRAKRLNAKSADTAVSDTLTWGSMRAYLPSQKIYPGVTLVAVKARATKNLNGQSADKFNVIATRKLPIYNTSTKSWSAETATRNIAPAVAYILRSSNGAGLADASIALDQLWSLQTTWTARGDKFDGGFDTRKGLWDCLQSVLQVGRTIPLIAGPKIVFIRDEQKTAYRAAFSARNMLPGSFNVDYIFQDDSSVDALLGTFIDERTWKSNTVLAKMPDSDATEETATTIEFFGAVQRSQVWRELMHRVAVNRYRRRFPNFRTEMEGGVCFKGDLIKVGHWLPKWGVAADVIACEYHSDGDILTLSEPWSPPVGQEALQKLITIAAPDGCLCNTVGFSVLDDGTQSRHAKVKLSAIARPSSGKYAYYGVDGWPVWSGSGLQLERPKAIFGTAEEQPQNCLVVSMKPDQGDTTTVAAVIDDARVYTADAGDPPEEVGGPTSTVGANLVISNYTITEQMVGSAVRTTIVVSGASDASSFEYRVKARSDNSWGSIVTGQGRTFTFDHAPAVLLIQVCAKGDSGFGPWMEKIYNADGGVDTIPANVGTISSSPYPYDQNLAENFSWSPVTGALQYHIQVWGPIGDIRDFYQDGTTFVYYPADAINDGGPFQYMGIRVKAVNSAGESPQWTTKGSNS